MECASSLGSSCHYQDLENVMNLLMVMLIVDTAQEETPRCYRGLPAIRYYYYYDCTMTES